MSDVVSSRVCINTGLHRCSVVAKWEKYFWKEFQHLGWAYYTGDGNGPETDTGTHVRSHGSYRLCVCVCFAVPSLSSYPTRTYA